jgi:hypothetical protein
MLAKPSSGK